MTAAQEQLRKLRIEPSRKGGQRTRRAVRWVAWIILLAAVGGGLYAMPFVVPTEVDTVGLTRVDPGVTTSTVALYVTGYVVPHRRIELAPKVIARVAALNADKGDRVTSGQVIVRLEDDEFRANHERAAASVARAAARLDELRSGSRAEEVEEARANLQLAEAQRDDAGRTVGRLRPLVSQGVENQQALDTAATQLAVAGARVNAARTRLELLVAGPRPETIRAAEADLAEARAALALADVQLGECVIRAPITGTVLERIAEVGELVTNQNFGGRGARGALLSMADLNDMQVEVDLNQTDLARVRMDQTCLVSLEAYPDRNYLGRVVQMAPEANRQKSTVQVKVQVLDPDDRMRPELNARVSFLDELRAGDGKEPEPRIFAPVSALIERDGSPTLVVADGARARLRAVRRGMETPSGVEITGGVDGTERVLVKPPDGIRDGAAIRQRKTAD